MSAVLAPLVSYLVIWATGAATGWMAKVLHISLNPAVPASVIPTAQPVNGVPPLIMSLVQSFVAWEQQQSQQQQHADVANRFVQLLKTQGATLTTQAAATFQAPATQNAPAHA